MSRGTFAPMVLAGAVLALATSAAIVLASPARVLARPHAGDQTYYRFAYRGEGVDLPAAMFAAAGNRGEQRTYTEIGGVLVRTVVGTNDAAITVVWNLIDARVVYRGGPASLDALGESALQSALQRPYVARYARDGRALALASAPETNGFTNAFLRALFGRLQIVTPQHASPIDDSWQIVEPDFEGAHRATYVLDRFASGLFDDATIGFTRSTTLLDGRTQGDALDGRPTLVAFDTDRGVFDARGALVDLHSIESQTVLSGVRTIGRSQSHLDLDRISDATLDDARVAHTLAFARTRLASPDAVALHVVESDRALAARAARLELGKLTEAALVKLVRAAAPSTRGDVRSTLGGKVAALLTLHPATTERIALLARTSEPSTLRFQIVVTALSQVDTPRSQSALCALLRARAADERAGSAVALALATSRAPIGEAVATLEHVADADAGDASGQAELSLGTLAHTARARDAALARAIVDRLDRRLLAAHGADLSREDLAFAALGNAGSDRSLPVLLPYRADARPQIRADVARALRGVGDSRADDVLADLLADRVAAVRLAAATALRDRQPSATALRALEAAAREDDDRDVRSSAAAALWNARATYPETGAIVRAIARVDPDPRVRSATADRIAESGNDLPTGVLPPDAALRDE